MCHFVSWVEKRGKVYFLTGDQLFSEKGQDWIQEHHISLDDLNGHGTIRLWYGIDAGDGIDKECVDFTTPGNFPAKIQDAIKKGLMRGLGVSDTLLTQASFTEYEKRERVAFDEYEKKTQPALAEYDKRERVAFDEYEKIRQWADYEKTRQTALADYKKIEQPTWDDYEKIKQTAFWDLFTIPENRNPVWG